jgi:Cu-Zn family superoxide dismutase
MKKLLIALATILPLAACSSSKPMPMAMAMLVPTANQTAKGMIHFMENRDGSVEVQVDLTGVPAGVHGFHAHDKGDCSDNGMASGGHYNPLNAPHAGPEAASKHAGDFGNVTANENGIVNTMFTTRSITVSPGPISVAGHAIILHANADDLTTQPSGNAGARIACGIVQSMEGSMDHMDHTGH